jgi:hypothetical protein
MLFKLCAEFPNGIGFILFPSWIKVPGQEVSCFTSPYLPNDNHAIHLFDGAHPQRAHGIILHNGT